MHTLLEEEIQVESKLDFSVALQDKREALHIGRKVKIISNLEGNHDEPFVGLKGMIYRMNKRADWYEIMLDNTTEYGKKFNFHINEIEIVNEAE